MDDYFSPPADRLLIAKIWSVIWPPITFVFSQVIVGLVYFIIYIVKEPQAINDWDWLNNSILQHLYDNVFFITIICNLIALSVFIPIYIVHSKKRGNYNHMKAINPLIYILSIIASISLAFLLSCLVSFLPEDFGQYDEIVSRLNSGSVYTRFWAICVIAPIAEELCFRGLCQNNAERCVKLWTAIIFQALIFGVVHGNIVQSSYAFLLGIFLGWIYARSRSLIVPIICHMVINSTSFFGELFLPDVDIPMLFVLAPAIAVSIIAIHLIRKINPLLTPVV